MCVCLVGGGVPGPGRGCLLGGVCSGGVPALGGGGVPGPGGTPTPLLPPSVDRILDTRL